MLVNFDWAPFLCLWFLTLLQHYCICLLDTSEKRTPFLSLDIRILEFGNKKKYVQIHREISTHEIFAMLGEIDSDNESDFYNLLED